MQENLNFLIFFWFQWSKIYKKRSKNPMQFFCNLYHTSFFGLDVNILSLKLQIKRKFIICNITNNTSLEHFSHWPFSLNRLIELSSDLSRQNIKTLSNVFIQSAGGDLVFVHTGNVHRTKLSINNTFWKRSPKYSSKTYLPVLGTGQFFNSPVIIPQVSVTNAREINWGMNKWILRAK